LESQPSSRTGENPPYGMIGRIEETSASFEARSAPRSYPTNCDILLHQREMNRLSCAFENNSRVRPSDKENGSLRRMTSIQVTGALVAVRNSHLPCGEAKDREYSGGARE